jgi:tetratricopeptide (TPR) repeat protein
MNLIKNSLGFNKTLFILILLVIIFLGGINVYFVLKSSRLSKELNSQKTNAEQSTKENVALQNKYLKLQSDFDKIQKDNQAIILDRDNIKAQVRSLLKDRDSAKELEQNLEKSKKDLDAIAKEKQDLFDRILVLQGEIKDLQTSQKQLITEKEQLAQTLSFERDKNNIRKIEAENRSLKKENTELVRRVKSNEAEIVNLKASESKAEEELKQAVNKADKLNKDYAEAVRKNKTFEQKVSETPSKFAELARQNRALIKETASMHYNLGVFYMKQKDYTRAVSEFEKSIELVPGDAYAHFNLGYIYAEYLVNRKKAIEHFQKYLRSAKKEDKDIDWVKKYIITWESWQGDQQLE